MRIAREGRSRTRGGARRHGAAAVVALAVGLAGCAAGPSDFGDFPDVIAPPQQAGIVTKSPEQLAATEESLLAAARAQGGAATRADDTLGPAMALAVIRQQQEEEARQLLQETGDMPWPPPAE